MGDTRTTTERALESGGLSNIDDDLNSPSSQLNPSSTTIFHQAVVVDFVSTPTEYISREVTVNSETSTVEEMLKRSVEKGSVDRVRKMPRNSIIARRVGNQTSSDNKKEIFYPFFSPHLCLPVKAGEKVWVVYEKIGDTINLGYWISRVVGDDDVDDLNYTHVDRYVSNIKDTQGPEAGAMAAHNEETEETSSDLPNPLGFPAGGGQMRSRNTLKDVGDRTGYDSIVNSSNSYSEQYTPEPVPRFSKRCPDLTLQGSNNTLITLGEDRGITLGTGIDTTIPGMGTIDIVAGRSVQLNDGRFIYEEAGELGASKSIGVSSDENPTSPAGVAKNTREVTEIDKTPDATDVATPSNINEGDPDFINDLSRVYVSMKTSGDANFNLEYPALNGGDAVEPVNDDAYVVLRSNQIRIIAKYSDTQQRDGESINGSIKIIKQGVEDNPETGRAVIIMQPDGTIMIDGPKIIIGSGIDKANGAGEQIYLGRDAKESIVLGDKLNSILKDLLNEMLKAAPTYVATAVGPGVLNPAVVTAITTLIGELEAKSNLSTIGKTK